MSTDRYSSPLSERYASKEMQYIFSQDMKFSTWRKLWIALAETEMELGLSENGKPVITQEQIDEMKEHVYDINYDVAKEREKLVRHDVMSHVYAFGQQCPKAAGIIHLGATSCYVGDNTDIIIMNEALKLVHKKLVNVIAELAKFADTYKNLPTLAFTHFQPAQPTTVGKRATLWTQEFLMDLEDLEYVMGTLKLLGSKGTTGTQASFLELFEGDQETIDKIDPMIAAKMGFKECYAVSGQTYSRKVDTRVANILAGIAASAHKMSNDIRLLQHLKEVEEPFEKNQIGSSAMAYKRNPMRSERIASLSRYVMIDALNPAITSATQWFERTLDDSANKRLSIPEGFLAIDGIRLLAGAGRRRATAALHARRERGAPPERRHGGDALHGRPNHRHGVAVHDPAHGRPALHRNASRRGPRPPRRHAARCARRTRTVKFRHQMNLEKRLFRNRKKCRTAPKTFHL